jgi:hypothetical protein
MKTLRGPLLVALAVSAVLISSVGAQMSPTGEKVALKYKSYSKWDVVLPAETFTTVGGKIAIAHANGDGFAAEVDGMALSVDTNGDGKGDVKAKGTAGLVTLKAVTAEGKPLVYTVRLVNNAGTWSFAASGAMVGSFQNETIRVIDQNNNGRYNDYGQDALVVGKGDAAAFLSKVVSIGGALYGLEVNEAGDELTIAPFEGKAGTLDVVSKFETKGKLQAAVVRSSDGTSSFELSTAKGGLVVPEGKYEIVAGLVTMGKESVRIKTGKSKPITVHAGQPAVFEWGGPLTADFTYVREGEKVTFAPTSLWFYGRAGEEYTQWIPDGAPPKFVVSDAKSGKEFAVAKFGGC